MTLEYIHNDGGHSQISEFKNRTEGMCFVRAYSIFTGTNFDINYYNIAGTITKWRMDAYTTAAIQSLQEWRGLTIIQTRQAFALGTPMEVCELILKKLGLKKFNNAGGYLSLEELSNRFGDGIVFLPRHAIAVKDGALQDSFDCRNWSVLSYWHF